MEPYVIVDYKKSISGINNLNRKIVPYCIQSKGLKWYFKIAQLFREIAMFDSYIAWKNFNNSNTT